MRNNSSILFVIDYPTIEDDQYGILFSGLNPRASMIYKIIKSLGLKEENFSFLPMCSCVVNSKSIVTHKVFKHCMNAKLEYILNNYDIKGIVLFGVETAYYFLGRPIEDLSDVRGKIYSFHINDKIYPMIVTYQLGTLVKTGCSSCGGANARQHLTCIDIEKLIIELKRKGVKFIK